MAEKSVEQLCRDLLEAAIKDGVVRVNADDLGHSDPQRLSAGDMTGMANLLNEILGRTS
jgi:hypothetical protein